MSTQTTNSTTAATVIKPKKNHKKRFLKVLAVILCTVIAIGAIVTIVNVIGLSANKNKAGSFSAVDKTDSLRFENTDNGCWTIFSDRDIKVLQLTDVHIGGGFMSTNKDSMAMNAVAALITEEKPDLVIVTGDLAYPVPFQAGTFNNKSGATIFAELMESLSINWTCCFGNHDTEAYSYYTREEITDFYSSGDYPHCLLQAGPADVDGFGNQVFSVKNSDGIITRSFILFDSHSYVNGDILGINWYYDNVHANQVEWYKNTVNKLSAENNEVISAMSDEKAAQYENNKTVKSSVFMHIPLTEYRDAWNEYVGNSYKDTENVTYNYGVAGESGSVVYCGIGDDELFETMLELKSTDSVFCGHDHLNNFSLNYKGINLNYGMSIDYLAYSGISHLGTQRGCTVLDVDKQGNLVSHNENYYQDKFLSQYAKESVTMQEIKNG